MVIHISASPFETYVAAMQVFYSLALEDDILYSLINIG